MTICIWTWEQRLGLVLWEEQQIESICSHGQEKQGGVEMTSISDEQGMKTLTPMEYRKDLKGIQWKTLSQPIRQLGKDLGPERKIKEGEKGGGARRMERQKEEETERWWEEWKRREEGGDRKGMKEREGMEDVVMRRVGLLFVPPGSRTASFISEITTHKLYSFKHCLAH